jgi:hypothetical protein
MASARTAVARQWGPSGPAGSTTQQQVPADSPSFSQKCSQVALVTRLPAQHSQAERHQRVQARWTALPGLLKS